jgi:hypothetical protein
MTPKPNPVSANPISEVLEQKAKVCATIAGDMEEEALTGESHEKAANEADAKVWQQKSEVWQEAAAIVEAGATKPVPPIQQ